jgi:MoaA/NifB/PqqE/SkfB family radical SAM enzyme
MRCNLRCRGCYARFHDRDEELSFPVLLSTIASAEAHGVFLFVITGGEPYMRPEMLDLYRAHPRSIFLTVSNGTLVDEETARKIARCRNVLPMISIEGEREHTDSRRGPGVHRRVLACMDRLNRQGILFGFSAVVGRGNIETLGSEAFVEEMVERGCRVGFYNDLIPLSGEDLTELPLPEQKNRFRCRLAELRRRQPIVLVHLPEDEYDQSGRCLAVGGGAMHINARGFAEPCPFAHYARENVNSHDFGQLLRSPFLAALRRHPTVLIHGEVGCSLVNNSSILEQIASETGAAPTRSAARPVTSCTADGVQRSPDGARSDR